MANSSFAFWNFLEFFFLNIFDMQLNPGMWNPRIWRADFTDPQWKQNSVYDNKTSLL